MLLNSKRGNVKKKILSRKKKKKNERQFTDNVKINQIKTGKTLLCQKKNPTQNSFKTKKESLITK